MRSVAKGLRPSSFWYGRLLVQKWLVDWDTEHGNPHGIMVAHECAGGLHATATLAGLRPQRRVGCHPATRWVRWPSERRDSHRAAAHAVRWLEKHAEPQSWT